MTFNLPLKDRLLVRLGKRNFKIARQMFMGRKDPQYGGETNIIPSHLHCDSFNCSILQLGDYFSDTL